MRKLQDGTEVEELLKPVTISVHTKCPAKYKLIDMETGIEYVGQVPDEHGHYHWKRKD